jgi:hypothetical protein
MEALRPHQEKALTELKSGKILCGGVGTGKSRTALAYYMQSESPKPLYVITTAKKRDSLDWHDEATHFPFEDGTLYDHIIVDSWNKIANYTEVSNAFFIFDEQRLVGSGAWVKSFLRIAKQNSWILLSATPGDTWLDYVPVFVANGFYKNRTEFVRQHVVFKRHVKWPAVERFVGSRRLNSNRASILVDMPMDRHTTRHSHVVDCDYDTELMDKAVKDRWNPYEQAPIKDAGELFRVMRRVSNSHSSRQKAILDLLQSHPRLIVFYNFNYELIALRDLDDRVQIAEWNGWKHEPVPDTDSWLYLVQYTAGAEGWNCVSTDTTVFYSQPYSYKAFEQAHGRIDRLNTPYANLHYYVLKSKAPIDRVISDALDRKEDFNERRYWPEWTK